MKVRELIELLKKQDQDAEVAYLYPYGDRAGHVVASPVEEVERQCLRWSEYHQSFRVTDETTRDQRVCLYEEGLVIDGG